MLHAFNLELGLCAHVEIDEKSNEIPAAQRLLGELHLTNCTVTLDALHCQKKHSRLPRRRAHNPRIKSGAQLKDNQPTLLHQVEALCASRDPESSDTSVTKGRNRHETRMVEVFPAASAVAKTEWKPLIKQTVRVTRTCCIAMPRPACREALRMSLIFRQFRHIGTHAATAIRGHWHIENTLHYTRDVISGKITPHPAQSLVFARLRSFAYNILQRNRTSTFSQERYAAALGGLDALLKLCFS